MNQPNNEQHSTADLADTFFINDYCVVSSAGRIECRGETTRLEPQVIRVLRYLAQRPGQVISRAEFLQACWPGVYVCDPALTRCITRLRQVFGDDARAPLFIETIPKVGYRLIASISTDKLTPRKTRRDRFWLLPAAATAVVAIAASFLLAAPDPFAAARADFDKGTASYAAYSFSDNENAIAFFEKAIAAEPEFAAAHAGLANALSQQALNYAGTRLAEARRHAARAIELQPDASASHRALGFALGLSGDLDRALRAYRVSIELDPGMWQAANNAAIIYLRQRDFDAAYAMFMQVIEHRPGNIAALTSLGYLESRRGNIAAAREWLNKSLAGRPVQPTATAHSAFLDLAEGKPSAAVERCEVMQRVFGSDYDCLRIIAVAGFLDGDLELAGDALARIENVWPGDAYAALGRAQLHARRGEQIAAEQLVRQVLDGNVVLRGAAQLDWDGDWLHAAALAVAGDNTAALDRLDGTVANGHRFFLWDRIEPAFSGIRDDDRFVRYLAGTAQSANFE